MELEEIQSICNSFPAVTEDIKWEHHLCFNVGGKMFLITSPDEYPITASFKVSDEDFEELSEREGFIPAPYLARNKWVKVDNINRLSAKQWKHYLESSYRIIASKLSAKERRRLGID